jgi:hypothetical protein
MKTPNRSLEKVPPRWPRKRPAGSAGRPWRTLPSPGALGLGILLAALAAREPAACRGASRGDEAPPAQPFRLAVLRRSIAQDQGAWVVTYQLRNAGSTGVILTPADLNARVEGWVSNSRVASHAIPRHSRVAVEGRSGSSASAEVVASAEESQRCRERAVMSIWSDDGPQPDGDAAPPLVSLGPGAKLHVKLRLEHHHVLYGDYDPLLGTRSLELRLGPALVRDQIPLEQEHYLAQPKSSWPEPPDDRRDTRHFVSAPDSLHLESQVPGHMYYRYPERPVRYGSKLRLQFWYLIAEGTEGECRVRLAQYKDTPSSWRVLGSGGFDQPLETVGRWTKYDAVVRADAEATTVALDFRIISETNVGELWIDDVSLEPIGSGHTRNRP